jgi:hypothetical protein
MLVTLAALLACKQGEEGGSGATCTGDGDCKNGFLCESKACIPKEAADKIRAAAKPQATPAPTASAAPPAEAKDERPADKDDGPIPAIPEDKSSPPTVAEWNAGPDVNTQNEHSRPDKCEMKIVREWLRVTCRGDIVRTEKMEGFGNKNADYFEMIKPGNMASYVVRLKRGKTQSVRICRANDRASLFVNWPSAKDRPVHAALGKGPAC